MTSKKPSPIAEAEVAAIELLAFMEGIPDLILQEKQIEEFFRKATVTFDGPEPESGTRRVHGRHG